MAVDRILFWNLWNMFKGEDTAWTAQPDKRYAEQFGEDGGLVFGSRAASVAERVAAFTGHPTGPCLLGFCELEMSPATIAAFVSALNSELGASYTAHYRQVRSARAICPLLLSKHPVAETRALSPEWRVIRSKVENLGQALHVYTCHWPSKVNDPEGEQRKLIAKIIYEDIVALGSGARALVWGDLNDTPSDASVSTSLKAGNSEASAVASTHPDLVLYDCMHSTSGSTHFHKGVGAILDHICCTGTLLSPSNPRLTPASTTIHTDAITYNGEPWRFGANPEDATDGFSDHYPVSVELVWG